MVAAPAAGYHGAVRRLAALFLVSGFPALLYQIAWQRALHTIYGVNVESVTMVVAAFLAGLGIGGVAGGAMSARRGTKHLVLFGVIETATGLYGLASPWLFARVGEATAGSGMLATGAWSFSLVFLPTCLMGATLPLLSAHAVGRIGNVGRSVGTLYFANTLGSAAACFAAIPLLEALGLRGTIRLAAAMNLLLGAAVLAISRGAGGAAPGDDAPRSGPDARRLTAAGAVAFGAGALAIAFEILWIHVYSFVTGGRPQTFAAVLGTYLAGIAWGSHRARAACLDPDDRGRPLRALRAVALAATALEFFFLPALANAVRIVPWEWTLPLVAALATLHGAFLPLLCHVAVPPDRRAGAGIGILYLANVAGSAAGGILTGFFLMDLWTVRGLSVALALGGFALAAAVAAWGEGPGRGRAGIASAAGAAACVLAAPVLFHDLYPRLQSKERYAPGWIERVVETRSGVVTVRRDGKVYGGGVEDGWFNVDPVDDVNLIVRPYALAAFHPAPREILLVGLSSGSWAQVLANHPAVERLTVVEINPGYLDVVRGRPEVTSLLTNPRVEIRIDDARRWMVAHPERTFDAVVSNTSWHWRANTSALLSREFLALVRSRLRPGGLFLYNTTRSNRAQRTGCETFAHAWRMHTFLWASDAPLTPDPERLRAALDAYRIDGRAVFDPSDPARRMARDETVRFVTDRIDGPDLRWGLEPRASILRRTAGLAPVTDDNMGDEWTARPRSIPCD